MKVSYRGISLLISITLFQLIFSCSKEEKLKPIPLPPAPISALEEQWGVVTSHFLRIRENPEKGSRIIAHIRRGTIVEILTRTTKMEKIDDIEGYWYQVDYKGLKGWVFGGYIKEFESKSAAIKYRNSLSKK